MATTPLLTVGELGIPANVHTLAGFRAWVATLDESAPLVSYSRGEVHVEVSQSYRTHGPVTTEINGALSVLTKELGLGRYCTPPSWFTDEAADLSTEPDGFLVLYSSFENGRVQINPELEIEMLGAPDMVLEVVSKSSVRKDTVLLPRSYARARVSEFWLVDARSSRPDLRILVLGKHGRYGEQPRDTRGFVASPIFQRSFRLKRTVDRAGLPDFSLELRRAPRAPRGA